MTLSGLGGGSVVVEELRLFPGQKSLQFSAEACASDLRGYGWEICGPGQDGDPILDGFRQHAKEGLIVPVNLERHKDQGVSHKPLQIDSLRRRNDVDITDLMIGSDAEKSGDQVLLQLFEAPENQHRRLAFASQLSSGRHYFRGHHAAPFDACSSSSILGPRTSNILLVTPP
jgi:hypothetical protein